MVSCRNEEWSLVMTSSHCNQMRLANKWMWFFLFISNRKASEALECVGIHHMTFHFRRFHFLQFLSYEILNLNSQFYLKYNQIQIINVHFDLSLSLSADHVITTFYCIIFHTYLLFGYGLYTSATNKTKINCASTEWTKLIVQEPSAVA